MKLSRTPRLIRIAQGFPVAVVALLWMAFAVAILVFPTTPGPSGADMNYTVVVLGGWLLLCIAYYYLPKYGGVHWFTGPVANIELSSGNGASRESVEVDVQDEKLEKE